MLKQLGGSELIVAANKGRVEIVKLLIDVGVDLNVKDEVICIHDIKSLYKIQPIYMYLLTKDTTVGHLFITHIYNILFPFLFFFW